MKKFRLFLLSILICQIGNLFAQATYEVGKVYEIDGVKGIVYKVSKNGRHGMMMSLNAVPKKQSKFLTQKLHENVSIVTDSTNGKNNMEAVAKYIETNNLTWDEFPLYNWANNLGNGWYIPSYCETKEMLTALCGFSEQRKGNIVQKTILQDKMKKEINKKLQDNGGDAISFPMLCSFTQIYKTKKKEYARILYYAPVSESSSGGSGLLGSIIALGSNIAKAADGVTPIQLLYTNQRKVKFIGTRAVRAF